MPAILPTVAAVVGIGSSVNNLVNGRRQANAVGNQAAAAADPFAEQRPFFQELLKGFIPNVLSQDPTQWLRQNPFVQQTMEDITKGTKLEYAAQRKLNAGGVLPELQKRETAAMMGFQNQWFNQQSTNAQLLALLSGATTSQPGQAGQALYGAGMSGILGQNNAWGSLPTQLNSLANGWGRGNNGSPGYVWGSQGEDGLGD